MVQDIQTARVIEDYRKENDERPYSGSKDFSSLSHSSSQSLQFLGRTLGTAFSLNFPNGSFPSSQFAKAWAILKSSTNLLYLLSVFNSERALLAAGKARKGILS